MPTTATSLKTLSNLRICILGDASIDTLLVPLPQSSPFQPPPRHDNWLRYRRRGGVWLAEEMVKAAVTFNAEAARVETYDPEKSKVSDHHLQSKLNLPFPSTATFLGLFSQDDGKDNQVLRIERSLGLVHGDYETDLEARQESYKRSLEKCLESNAPRTSPDIVLLHDREGYFRDLQWGTTYRHILMKLQSSWIVWHVGRNLKESELSKAYGSINSLKSKTIAVVQSDGFLEAGANLPDGISLEREAQNFLWSVKNISDLVELAKSARHLIVHFQRQGVLHFDTKKGMTTSCYYCPEMIVQRDNPEYGQMHGYTTLLCAALIRGIAWALTDTSTASEADRVADGIVAGIRMSAILDHRYFYSGMADSNRVKSAKASPFKDEGVALFSKLFKELENVDYDKDEWSRYRVAAIKLPIGASHDSAKLSSWNRIDGFAKKIANKGDHEPLVEEDFIELGRRIVRAGLEKTIAIVSPESRQVGTLRELDSVPPADIDCPYEIHGKIKTADRVEIERYAAIRRIVYKYLKCPEWKHPLCLAVFGPPGSGKNFTLKQLLTSIDQRLAEHPLEFNLAQFTGIDDLKTAFHQAQDRAIAGEIPLVIFDEFDCRFETNDLGWLKYFLAPMQDGKFKAGDNMYRIGRSIMVFVGGQFKSFSELSTAVKKVTPKPPKGDDFVSRLRGHLDILGVNIGDIDESGNEMTLSARLVFRRAVMLRSLLEDRFGDIIHEDGAAQVENDVLNAFLRIDRYEHGARSMQAIVDMSDASTGGVFRKASLPPCSQLDMHVNAVQFRKLANCLDTADVVLTRGSETRRRGKSTSPKVKSPIRMAKTPSKQRK